MTRQKMSMSASRTVRYRVRASLVAFSISLSAQPRAGPIGHIAGKLTLVEGPARFLDHELRIATGKVLGRFLRVVPFPLDRAAWHIGQVAQIAVASHDVVAGRDQIRVSHEFAVDVMPLVIAVQDHHYT